jgi:hypothetical protein
MTIPATEEFGEGDRLARNFELYRDLSLALTESIARVRAGGDAACTDVADAVKAHHRALQSVLDIEASLVKKSRTWTAGGGGELDLVAARAEILARLAAWGGAG